MILSGEAAQHREMEPLEQCERRARPAEGTPADILESITDPVVAFDKQWRYTYVTHRAAQALGKPVDEMLGTSMWDLSPDGIDAGFEEACECAWRENRPVSICHHSNVFDTWVES